MDQLLRETGGLKSSPYYLVFIEFFGPKKFNVFKVLAEKLVKKKPPGFPRGNLLGGDPKRFPAEISGRSRTAFYQPF